MSLGYSTVAIGGSIHEGKQPNTQYNLDGHSTADGILGCFNALGCVTLLTLHRAVKHRLELPIFVVMLSAVSSC